MRTPRLRFTVRQMVVVVAMGAACVFPVAMHQRNTIRKARGSHHAIRASEQRGILRAWQEGDVQVLGVTRQEAKAVAEWLERAISYHDAMSRKWEEASRYPWLPVDPDPPEPDYQEPSAI